MSVPATAPAVGGIGSRGARTGGGAEFAVVGAPSSPRVVAMLMGTLNARVWVDERRRVTWVGWRWVIDGRRGKEVQGLARDSVLDVYIFVHFF